MPFIDIHGHRLETRIIPGAATGPWLVFLHEGLGCVALWRDFPDRLARRLDLPALVYSRRSYGQSDPLAGPRDVDFMHHEALQVLPELLARCGIGKALLVGHSDGASIGLIYAATFPRHVAGLVAMAPHVLVEPVSVESIARVASAYADGDLRGRLARHHAHVDDAFLGWSRIWLDPRFRAWSLAPECRQLAVPTLLIQGRGDEYGTLAQLEAIERAAPGPTTRLLLDDCGHSPHRDQEAAVLAAIAQFAGPLLTPLAR